MNNNWQIKKALSEFSRYKTNWQALGHQVLGFQHPLIDVDYVEPLIKYFGDDNLFLATCGNNGDGGMLLLNRLNFAVWQCFYPSTGPFSFSLIKGNNDQVKDKLTSLFKALPGWGALLGINKLDPANLTVGLDPGSRRAEKLEYIETINIPINKPFEAYWGERSKNLKRNIIKKMNRIERDGISFNFKELRNPEEMEAGVKIYGEMESSGWKGEKGSAVDIDNHQGRFYVDMLKRFAGRQNACIYQLVFNDQVVASALTIRCKKMVVILKITYDENMKDYSPGMLMYYEMHKRLFETRESEHIEYYGRATQRMQQWAVNIRTIYHLNYYRSSVVKCAADFVRKMKNRMQATDNS